MTALSSSKEKATSGLRADESNRIASTSLAFDGSLLSSLRSLSDGLWILGVSGFALEETLLTIKLPLNQQLPIYHNL